MIKFEKPQYKVTEYDETSNYGKFELEPLEKGFGLTLGNALRRVMLSSLPGSAITSINIDGVDHEFQTITGIYEDVTTIVLNLKGIVIKNYSEEDQVLTLNVDKEGVVTAADIDCPADVEIINKDQEICTIVSGGKINMEITVSNGRGYVRAEANKKLLKKAKIGTIAIDSKFPLEHYQLMVDKSLTQDMRDNYEKMFKQDMKKHIDAISSKYIISGETADQAILFLPAEAIFAEVNAYHQDIIEYAYKKRVWITSPTTLMSTLTTVEVIIKNQERDKYAKVIQEELSKLGVEFGRYKERWDKLSRSIETVSKDVQDIHTTTDKITKRFNSINQVEMEEIDE
jgi:hypothetical protein